MYKRGYTLIEVILFLGLVTMTFYFVSGSLEQRKTSEALNTAKSDITIFIRKIQKYGFYNKKEYLLEFQFSNNKLVFKDSDNQIIEEIKLSDNIKYISNNADKKADFTRKTTKDGNFDKGFSVFLLDKKQTKVYYKIGISTVNSMKYPVISIYKAEKPISINENYLDYSLWKEEL